MIQKSYIYKNQTLEIRADEEEGRCFLNGHELFHCIADEMDDEFDVFEEIISEFVEFMRQMVDQVMEETEDETD